MKVNLFTDGLLLIMGVIHQDHIQSHRKELSHEKTLVSIFIVLVLTLLLVVTPAIAQAERIILEGTEDIFIAGAPSRVWEADGWSQHRDVPFTGTFDFGVMQGMETQLVNAKLNPVTGEGRVWGVVTYTDSSTGITCSGTLEAKLTNFLRTAKVVAPERNHPRH